MKPLVPHSPRGSVRSVHPRGRSMRSRLLGVFVAVLFIGSGVALSACDDSVQVELDAAPDARVKLVAVDLSRANAETIAYVDRVAAAHAEADALLPGRPADALERLRAVWTETAPAQDAARVTHLELSARMGELMMKNEGGAVDAVALLRPLLSPESELPRDRCSARALVALGDAATAIDDDALAAGSYARAVRVMSALRKEMKP